MGYFRGFQKKTNREIFSLKEFVFLFMYDKTETCFDYDREYVHFLEPDTVRSLYNTIELLNKLDSYDHALQSKIDIKKFQENIEWIEEDCVFRYKEEILVHSKDESHLISLWMQEPICRRSRSIVKKISQKTIPLGLDIKREYNNVLVDIKRLDGDPKKIKTTLKFDNSHVEYSYAELVHSFFHMTRDDQAYSKKFVSFLLYSYTLHLTEIYRLYRWNKHNQITKEAFMKRYREGVVPENIDEMFIKKTSESQKYYYILLDMIGKTMYGKWAQYFFPDVTVSALSGNESSYVGSPIRGVLVGYIEHQPNEFPLEFFPDDTEERVLIKIKAFIFVSMMNVTALNVNSGKINSTNIKWEFRENDCTLRLEQGSEDDYELTAFLKHVFSYTEYFSKYERSIRNPLKSCKMLYAANLDAKIGKAFDRLWDEYYEWDHKYGNALIPFYNLDITYNMIKKRFLNYNSDIPTLHIQMNDENTTFLIEYKKMLDKFKDYLKNIDCVYQLEDLNSFSEIMSSCPFYKMINELQADPQCRIAVSNNICNVVMRKLEDRTSSEAPVG